MRRRFKLEVDVTFSCGQSVLMEKCAMLSLTTQVASRLIERLVPMCKSIKGKSNEANTDFRHVERPAVSARSNQINLVEFDKAKNICPSQKLLKL